METAKRTGGSLVNLRRVPGAGRLYRAAAPAGLGPEGLAALEALSLGTIVDLREPAEAAAAPGHLPAGARYVSVPLYRGQVPLAEPIGAVYERLLTTRGTELAEAVRAVAAGLRSPAGKPDGVLVHCAAGKDRTGLVVALALAAAGTARAGIVADYCRSGEGLSADYRSRVAARLGALLPPGPELDTALELHLASPASALESALDLLETRYGGAADFLLAHGLDPAELAALCRDLGTPVGAHA
ncbi:tyrosine-protein phosphatase [Arthrobacter ginkgonis]|uniref:Tyrosine-protein phosphatase n=1 Tax=Arthrobacter ginkgonis TaxID=1630594 RepID=A0ABP7DCS7_9MICC